MVDIAAADEPPLKKRTLDRVLEGLRSHKDVEQEISSLGYNRFCTDRLFEWVMAVAMLCICITLSMPGETLDRAALTPMIGVGLTEDFLAGFFGIVGTLRAFALFANGRLRISGARFRAWGAAAGAFIWMQMALILLLDSIGSGRASLLMPILFAVTGGEMVSCYRAIFDAGRRSV